MAAGRGKQGRMGPGWGFVMPLSGELAAFGKSRDRRIKG